MIYTCCDERRRNALRGSALNGIDYLEVLDHDAPAPADRQRTLFVHFINALVAPLGVPQVRVEGGERIHPIVVTGVSQPAPDVIAVRVNQPGDYSPYTLRLVTSAIDDTPPAGFDPLASAVEFSFKVECPTEFDCAPERICPPEAPPEPPIDYLAKDYGSFRRLMLDRMAALAPNWTERNPADLGIALVEALAYAADHLSYRQDAVATEAYLHTARRRVSLRRHARLVDYLMHDGCNGRTWVQVQVSGDGVSLNRHTAAGGITQLLTQIPGQSVRIEPGSPAHREALAAGPVVFELMEDRTLHQAHNAMHLYTWGDARCCLPKGATRATLLGHLPGLLAGAVIIFEEVLGPRTGLPGDRDPSHRYAVRLTSVQAADAGGGPLADPLTGQAITEIRWHEGDALPAPVCVSAVTDAGDFLDGVSLVRGNIVLADHGRTLDGEALGSVPAPWIWEVPDPAADRCEPAVRVPLPPRFRPALRERPLTAATAYDPAAAARRALSQPSPDRAVPAIWLLDGHGDVWGPRHDLLNSGPLDRDFVVEMEADGTASLRFGDDVHGQRPDSGLTFTATYRIGNGRPGNIGADALAHIVTDNLPITGVRNLVPARGGVDPETMEEVRQKAPVAFRRQERAVTETDYADVTARHVAVQRAAATFRWTGSWHTVYVTVDRKGGLRADAPFQGQILEHIEPFRIAGYDLEVDAPRFVSLEIEMHVCAEPTYFRSDVKADLLDVFSSGTLPDGRQGLFHPDNFTFGQTIYLSPIYAAAQAVPGVASVQITMFQRQGTPDPAPLADGMLVLGRLEIARLDNDRNYPEHGVLRITMGGGK
ncbi:MAG TPA: putative baseplate assembly protein [bacterium]|jgi:hypothetical protein|nr:putative baseplate assembly protein [bacterium]